MRRSPIFGLKILLPPTVILFLVLASFTIPLDSNGTNAVTRLSVCNSALMSAVIYHATTKSPSTGADKKTLTHRLFTAPLGTISLLDEYLLVIYCITLASVAATILILRLWAKASQKAKNFAEVHSVFSGHSVLIHIACGQVYGVICMAHSSYGFPVSLHGLVGGFASTPIAFRGYDSSTVRRDVSAALLII